jgi:CheY-like chemotaxis protein
MLAYAGKGQFVVQPLDLSKIVRDTLPLAERSIGKGVHVELALSEQLPPVEADATQIEQVAMNFILNAAEAIGDRPGRISIRTGVRDIRPGEPAGSYDVGQPEPGRYAMLEVQDTGPGIDEAIRASIFDPFFTTKFTGRGLGLAAVSGIVRSLNGAIQVESRPGQGSTFRVLFPVKAPPAPELHRARDPILVVDDDEIVRQTAQVMLRHRGYEVLLAENGQKAVDLFRERQGRVSLVLLDMTMPVMSGEEAFRLMKSIRPDVPVIVSSGYTEEEAIRRFGGLGVAGFMQKPYTVGALMEKIGRFALPR